MNPSPIQGGPMALSGPAIKERLTRVEERLSPFAAKAPHAFRRSEDPWEASGYRLPFALDVDRILHSHAFTRTIDKTQVFSLIGNDHLTHRVLHVQLVSRIGRTIGRALGLNEDLIEAMALGHDVGHPPFGHDGEVILSRLSEKMGLGPFRHNIQSVRFLDALEKGGRGWNLTFQTLDGIFCHNAESFDNPLSPNRDKGFHELDHEMAAMGRGEPIRPVPATLEGCVVKFADTISYIGRDIEDAIRLGIITRDELPKACTDLLGQTNGTIIYALVTDLIEASSEKDRIAYSPKVSETLKELKTFNLKRIYRSSALKEHLGNLEALFTEVFDRCLSDLKKQKENSPIMMGLSQKESHLRSEAPALVVRDFIAGMTDNYFLRLCPEELRPKILEMRP
ncbi:MAG: HD domain-containing protein [Desulfobacterales bacterium]|nr:HD domain-containing protein [Desulfobacterales bacterium]